MPTAEDLAADKIANTIRELREAKAANEGKIVDLQGAIDTMKGQFKALEQAQDAQMRSHTERQATGSNRDLDVYTPKSVPAGQLAEHYRVTGDGAVRLRGHLEEVRGKNPDQVRKVWRPGLLDDTAPRTPEQLELQRAVTARSIARHAMKPHKRWTPELDERVLECARAVGGETLQKILADNPGAGANWVPDVTIPEVEREVMIPTGLVGLFPRRVISSAGVVIPRINARVRFYIKQIPVQNDPAADPLSDLTTGEVTISTYSTAGGMQIDRDFEEDSIIAVLPEIQAAIVAGWRWCEDDTIMNSDGANPHQDAIQIWDPRGMLGGIVGLGTSLDHRRRGYGLRARAKDAEVVTGFGATDQGAAATWTGFRLAMTNLGVANMMQAHDGAANVVALCSWEYFFGTVLGWPEFASWDKMGALASILTGRVGDLASTPGGMLPGQVGFLQGMIPLCVTGTITADLAATGLFTGSGATTGMVIVDRTRFEYVIRKQLELEQEIDIRNNTRTIVARGRTAFRSVDPTPVSASGVRDVHYSFNLPA